MWVLGSFVIFSFIEFKCLVYFLDLHVICYCWFDLFHFICYIDHSLYKFVQYYISYHKLVFKRNINYCLKNILSIHNLLSLYFYNGFHLALYMCILLILCSFVYMHNIIVWVDLLLFSVLFDLLALLCFILSFIQFYIVITTVYMSSIYTNNVFYFCCLKKMCSFYRYFYLSKTEVQILTTELLNKLWPFI